MSTTTSLTAAQVQAKLRKKYEDISTGTDIPEVEFVSTGYVGFDYLLGGGLPLGRIVEVVGPTGTGKTIAGLSMLSALTKRQQIVYICDSENAIEQSYLELAGVDPNFVIIKRTACLNKALEFYHSVMSNPIDNNVGGFLFDTVKGFQPAGALTKLQNDSEAALMASAARVWSQHHGMMIELAASANAVVMFNNHIMTSLSPYGVPTSKPGGGTIPQISSVGLVVKGRGKKLDDDLKGMGPEYPGVQSVDLLVDKSRFGTLGRSVTIDLTTNGYDNLTTLIRLAKATGAIKATGAWYQVEVGEQSHRCHGLVQTHALLSEHPDLVAALTAQILANV